MPSSTRKKKEKAADFQKAKLKVGKGKQKAANATDTSFSAKAISLPSQSIGKDKSAVPTTRRNQTLQDLIAQSRHYSAPIRKDAVTSMQELLISYPEIIPRNLGPVINSVARLIGDQDGKVRKAVISIIDWFFDEEVVDPTVLEPYLPSTLLQTLSSLSNIFPEIRLDAIKVLDVLVRSVPGFLVGSGGGDWDGDEGSGNRGRVLESYLAVLNAKGGSGGGAIGASGANRGGGGGATMSTTLTPTARSQVLRSFASFLEATNSATPTAFTNTTSSSESPTKIPTWFFEDSFSDPIDFCNFVDRFSPRRNGGRGGDAWVEDGSGEKKKGMKRGAVGEMGGRGSKRRKMGESTAQTKEDEVGPGDLQKISEEEEEIGRHEADFVERFEFVSPLSSRPYSLSLLTHTFDLLTPSPSSAHPPHHQLNDPTQLQQQQPLSLLLSPILTSAFLDSAPSAFNPSAAITSSAPAGSSSSTDNGGTTSTSTATVTMTDVHLETCLSVLRISREVFRDSLRDRSSGLEGLGSSAVVGKGPRGSGRSREKAREKMQERVVKSLKGILSHGMVYFPFGGDDLVKRSVKAGEMVSQMNLIYSELVSLLEHSQTPALRTPTEGARIEPGPSSSEVPVTPMATGDPKIRVMMEKVRDWIEEVLRGKSQSPSMPLTPYISTPHIYILLLPTIWSILCLPTPTRDEETGDDEGDILGLVVQHWERLGSTSATKKLATEFLMRLCALPLHPSYNGLFSPYDPTTSNPTQAPSRLIRGNAPSRPTPDLLPPLSRFVKDLSRQLWELNTSSPTTSSMILRFLRSFVVTSASGRPNASRTQIVRTISEKLQPFFSLLHPTTGKEILGPFTRFASQHVAVQKDALALVSALAIFRRRHPSQALDGPDPAFDLLRRSVERGVGQVRMGRPSVFEGTIEGSEMDVAEFLREI